MNYNPISNLKATSKVHSIFKTLLIVLINLENSKFYKIIEQINENVIVSYSRATMID